MSRHQSLRASDADRDAVVDRLREAAVEGRLEPEELEERVDRALRARTYGELAALLTDLPDRGMRHLRRAGSRTSPVARTAMVGAGLVVAVTVVVAVVALLAVVVLVAAASWIALVLLRVALRGSHRHLAAGAAGRRSVSARHAHRARPTGLL